MANSFEDRVKGAVANLARNVNSSFVRATSPANDSSARSGASPSDSSFFQFGSPDDAAPIGDGSDQPDSGWPRFGSSPSSTSRAGSMVFAIGTIGIDYPTVAIRDRFEEIIRVAKAGNKVESDLARVFFNTAKQTSDTLAESVEALRAALKSAWDGRDTSYPDIQHELSVRESELAAAKTSLSDRKSAVKRVEEIKAQLFSIDTEISLKPYLEHHVNDAPLLNWVFKIDGIETFIVQPQGPFAQQYFVDVLVGGLGKRDTGLFGLRKLSGVVIGGGRLGSGAVLPIVAPEPEIRSRLLYNYFHSEIPLSKEQSDRLTQEEKDQRKAEQEAQDATRRQYTEIIRLFRRHGMSSEDRAINLVLADKLKEIFEVSARRMDPKDLHLGCIPDIDNITTEIADISRPGSTSIYVYVEVFDITDIFKNSVVHRYTIDVSLPEPNIFDGDSVSKIRRRNRGLE